MLGELYMHIPNIYSCNEYMYKNMYESVNKNLFKKISRNYSSAVQYILSILCTSLGKSLKLAYCIQ